VQYKTQRGERGGAKERGDSTRCREIVRNVAGGFRKLSKFIVAQERLYRPCTDHWLISISGASLESRPDSEDRDGAGMSTVLIFRIQENEK
jgi:hypothetical protein